MEELVGKNRLLRNRCSAASKQLDEAIAEAAGRKEHAAREAEHARSHSDEDARVELEALTAREEALFRQAGSLQADHAAMLRRMVAVQQGELHHKGQRLHEAGVQLSQRAAELACENASLARVVRAVQAPELQRRDRSAQPDHEAAQALGEDLAAAKKELRALVRAGADDGRSRTDDAEELNRLHAANLTIAANVKRHTAIERGFIRIEPAPPAQARQAGARSAATSPRKSQQVTRRQICKQLEQKLKLSRVDHDKQLAKIEHRRDLMEQLGAHLASLLAACR